jgi:hypothetical protein
MSTVKVLFIHSCGADVAGETKTIDARRAQRLQRTGYVELLEDPAEAAITQGSEQAARPRPQARGIKPERRG